MKPFDLKSSIYIHIKSFQKIRNCQMSDFFPKKAFGALIIPFLQACTSALYHVTVSTKSGEDHAHNVAPLSFIVRP